MSDLIQMEQRLKAYGADIAGIHSRFLGDMELYASCMQAYLEDDSFDALGEALAMGDCQKAFEAAHALKGVTGNMGLTPLYELVCAVTERLRRKSTDGVAEMYKEILSQRDVIRQMA